MYTSNIFIILCYVPFIHTCLTIIHHPSSISHPLATHHSSILISPPSPSPTLHASRSPIPSFHPAIINSFNSHAYHISIPSPNHSISRFPFLFHPCIHILSGKNTIWKFLTSQSLPSLPISPLLSFSTHRPLLFFYSRFCPVVCSVSLVTERYAPLPLPPFSPSTLYPTLYPSILFLNPLPPYPLSSIIYLSLPSSSLLFPPLPFCSPSIRFDMVDVRR
jgi:hypothetical protein